MPSFVLFEHRRRLAWAAMALLAATGAGCRSAGSGSGPEAPGRDPLRVREAKEEVVLAAWAEPRQLPRGGGASQILVRVQRRGGKPYRGVEVRLSTSAGTLYSNGRVLRTDVSGLTRDRLTTDRTATVTLNAGGTRYRLRVPVAGRR